MRKGKNNLTNFIKMLRVKLVKAYKINCQILSAINYSITNNRNCDLHKLTYIRFIKNASIQFGM